MHANWWKYTARGIDRKRAHTSLPTSDPCIFMILTIFSFGLNISWLVAYLFFLAGSIWNDTERSLSFVYWKGRICAHCDQKVLMNWNWFVVRVYLWLSVCMCTSIFIWCHYWNSRRLNGFCALCTCIEGAWWMFAQNFFFVFSLLSDISF